jgi:hypothetical protein
MAKQILTGQSITRNKDEIFNNLEGKYNKNFNNNDYIDSLEGITYIANQTYSDLLNSLDEPRERIDNIDKDLRFFSSGLVSGYLYGLTGKEKAKLDEKIEMRGRSTIYKLQEPNRPIDYN